MSTEADTALRAAALTALTDHLRDVRDGGPGCEGAVVERVAAYAAQHGCDAWTAVRELYPDACRERAS